MMGGKEHSMMDKEHKMNSNMGHHNKRATDKMMMDKEHKMNSNMGHHNKRAADKMMMGKENHEMGHNMKSNMHH
jgi:hypothetical protein